jgi:phosphatidylserine decarboxylase
MASDAQHRLRDWFINLYQYLLPQHILSQLMYHLTRHRIVWLTRLQIRLFTMFFKVNMEEAEASRIKDYPNFNTFFTRALRKSARPITKIVDEVACPVDGYISQIGSLTDGRLIQAKGWSYHLADLLGNSEAHVASFREGQFATLYLSPKDYHRVHMPLAGCVSEVIYLPGRLFSVSPKTVNGIPNLFARNERVINIFETRVGPMAMVLVGAIFVGSIETVWVGQITPPYRHHPSRWSNKENKTLRLEKGQEMGRFNMGSTVILILPSKTIRWQPSFQPGSRVVMGQAMGQLISTAQRETEKQQARA